MGRPFLDTENPLADDIDGGGVQHKRDGGKPTDKGREERGEIGGK